MRLFANDLGVDLGTANVLIYVDKKGIVVREPTVVAMDCNNGRLLQVGTEAKNMLGRTPGKLEAMRPLKEGVVADHAMAVQLLRDLFRRAAPKGLFSPKPRVVISVPSYITEVQSRTLVNAAIEAGAGRVFLVESPLAAAFGANLDFGGPKGHMVVDVGAGVTNIAVLSMNGVVRSTAIRVAGDSFDDAIIRYIRREKHMVIGKEVAEDIKIKIGCVDPRAKGTVLQISGLDAHGLGNKTCDLSSKELLDVLGRLVSQIAEEILVMLDSVTPELAKDICEGGITFTGGGSQLGGLCQMIEACTFIPCSLAEDPASCVVYGCGKSLVWINKQKEGAVNYDKERAMKGKAGGRR